ncbi:MAG: pyridoxamine 5'-phosphate oxidase family protein [Hamadaea sp.]|uniref:pyridoxamine 5'-phosphate oxidase family protein n=1 Tax=Hamadaea sp. TaxID=2024425 RepID=UPI0017C3EA9E|nr:pyridoxamine 5'-phosphate oxidase family protein [Hamadaea sp.]NUR71634.1 pyridoxamine 5'-phosphate oxidase family protein [Hamadaea sp.]NUT20198.1 pyridoxamine 5'-phosphate oxidase family protein [Hamadaea sp.]
MGQVYPHIDDRIRDFLLAQPVFFVATAPADPAGHVNLSPKGMSGSFAVLGPLRCAYLEYGGSGNETVSHLRDDPQHGGGRITLMFCAFSGPPKIYRLYGRGQVLLPQDPGFAELLANFPEPAPGLRNINVVDVTRVSDSCGYAVPLMEYREDRDLLSRYWDRRGPEEQAEYRARKNATSIDGVPVRW